MFFVGEAIKWNKVVFMGKARADHFIDLSFADIRAAQEEIRLAKKGFHEDCTGEVVRFNFLHLRKGLISNFDFHSVRMKF